MRSLSVAALIGLAAAAGSIAMAFGLVFAKLTESILRGEDLPTIDVRITSWFVDHRDDQVTAVLRPVTHLADPLVVVVVLLVAVVVLVRRHQRLPAIFLVVVASGAALLVQVVKLAVGRARPASVDRLVTVTGAAFPSGHAAQSVACYLGIAAVMAWMTRSRTVAAAAVVVAGVVCLLVGVSRIYLGVHWTSDVVAGWSLGLAWLAATIAVFAIAGFLSRAPRP